MDPRDIINPTPHSDLVESLINVLLNHTRLDQIVKVGVILSELRRVQLINFFSKVILKSSYGR